MRIAVISDTHDSLPEHVCRAITGADEIWHLGDVCSPAILTRLARIGPPLRVVRGNCDSYEEWPLHLELDIAGTRLQLIHIPPKKSPRGVQIVLHGHTHVPRNEIIGKTRFLNPGCVTRPNRGAPASFAWLELRPGIAPVWNLQLL